MPSFRVQRSSLSQNVYEQMKQLIFTHAIEPGEKIGLVDLARKLEVSLTPLREALTRLKGEGFVVHHPNRGYFVAEITATEVLELYGIREALESFALTLGVSRFKEEDITSIADAIEAHRRAVTERDGFLEDKVIHLRLASLAGNQLLLAMLELVLDRAIMKLRIDALPRARSVAAYAEHMDILRAVEKRNADEAIGHLKKHFAITREYILTFLGEQESKPQ